MATSVLKPEALQVAEARAIKVVVADSQSIYRVGIRKIFALEDEIRVVAQAENMEQALSAAGKFNPNVILFESAMNPSTEEAIAELLKRSPGSNLVVVTDRAEREDTVALFRAGVRGIVSRSISPALLVKCVRKVAEGETWLDKRGVNWVLEAYRAQSSPAITPRTKAKLSEKEFRIISLVTQGMRNKDVANVVGTTEQVVKNYLRKIYDKLGVADRLELALFCVNNGVLNSPRLVPQPQEMAPATGNVAPTV